VPVSPDFVPPPADWNLDENGVPFNQPAPAQGAQSNVVQSVLKQTGQGDHGKS